MLRGCKLICRKTRFTWVDKRPENSVESREDGRRLRSPSSRTPKTWKTRKRLERGGGQDQVRCLRDQRVCARVRRDGREGREELMANGRCTIASDDGGGLPLSQALPCKGGPTCNSAFVAPSRKQDLRPRIATASLESPPAARARSIPESLDEIITAWFACERQVPGPDGSLGLAFVN
ncbi:PREDICTED: uncharacterized protein LOC105569771 [Vollenhovia emeryi]|uniref:uncharacterized protein LOC105569771 n=1 Tax=Vollenhovia emeryi TaxID=411798 RepID=UPI0005F4E52F|nr:PREDICTED: uncharacterized protein LOC105569771 [Vollenhovia emeryi]